MAEVTQPETVKLELAKSFLCARERLNFFIFPNVPLGLGTFKIKLNENKYRKINLKWNDYFFFMTVTFS